MKKNGFITSAFLYGMLALFIALMLSTLAIMANRKISMDNLRDDAITNMKKESVSDDKSASEVIVEKTEEEKKEVGIVEDNNIDKNYTEKKEDNSLGGDGKRYVYQGASPKNYVLFNEELWRIMAIEANGKLKITKDSLIAAGVVYDERNHRSSDYCYASSGCNAWGSITTSYDNTGTEHITGMSIKENGTKFNLPEKESTLAIYLNNDYYNDLRDFAKALIADDGGTFNVGAIKLDSNQDLATDIEQVSSVKWKGKIGVPDVTEYVKASNNAECKSFSQGAILASGNKCRENNYLYVPAEDGVGKTWQLSTPKMGTVTDVYSVRPGDNNKNNDGYIANQQAWYGASIRPVIYLKPNLSIKQGDGSKENPYVFEVKS